MADIIEVPNWLSVSPQTVAKLEQFLAMVIRWNPAINLISAASLVQGWDRHVLDSAQLWGFAPMRSGLWLDIGSGGGFPGIVIALIAQELAPDVHFCLVECDRRKTVFLAEAVRVFQLAADVQCARIELLSSMKADVLSARAVASLSELLPIAALHLATSGVALFPKGRRYQTELDAASPHWKMQIETIPSRTDPDAAILKVRDLRNA